jgi:hypothetical protein
VRHLSGLRLKFGDRLRVGCPLTKNPYFLEMTMEGTRRKEPDLLIRESLDSDLVRRVGLVGLLLSSKTGWESWKVKVQKLAPQPPSSNWRKDDNGQSSGEWEGLRNLFFLLVDCEALDSIAVQDMSVPSLKDADLEFWFARLCRATARVYFRLDGFDIEKSPRTAGIFASLQWLVSDFCRRCETGLRSFFDDENVFRCVDIEISELKARKYVKEFDRIDRPKVCWLRVENECIAPVFESENFELSRQNLKVSSTFVSRNFPAALHRRGSLFELVPPKNACVDDINILLNSEPLRCACRLLNSGDVISFGNVDGQVHVTFIDPDDLWMTPSVSDVPRAKELTRNLVWAGEVIANQTKAHPKPRKYSIVDTGFSRLGDVLDRLVGKHNHGTELFCHFTSIMLAGPGNEEAYTMIASQEREKARYGPPPLKHCFRGMLWYFRNIETHFPTGMRKQPRDLKMELWFELLLKFCRYFLAGFADAVPGLKKTLVFELRLIAPNVEKK